VFLVHEIALELMSLDKAACLRCPRHRCQMMGDVVAVMRAFLMVDAGKNG
jgi:hypothetical protein